MATFTGANSAQTAAWLIIKVTDANNTNPEIIEIGL
jgi:hypothetical protein